MRFHFRTLFGITLILITILVSVSESSIIRKAKPVRVVREKTRLEDGTKFERYLEKDLPPLPIEEEEETDDLSDPRIGHLDNAGSIVVPVDAQGRVLKGYEYLLKPITIELDFDEKDLKRKPSGDSYEIPNGSQNGEQTDYKPYSNNPDMFPKPEFLPGKQETVGEEYDDVASEPREPLSNVPDLPKPDYTDSGESDEDLKASDGADEKEETDGRQEVILPSSNIDLPISKDDVDEINKSADDVENETETKNQDFDDDDKSIDIPKNRVNTVPEIKEEDKNEIDVDRADENVEDENVIELSDSELEELAQDFGKGILDNVMNKASEFAGSDKESVDGDLYVDPNSIVAQSELPQPPKVPQERIVDSEDLDGVILPDQTLSDEELAKIAAERLKPVDTVVPKPVPGSNPSVRGGRIGSGVRPDSATQHNIFLQFLTVSLVLLFL